MDEKDRKALAEGWRQIMQTARPLSAPSRTFVQRQTYPVSATVPPSTTQTIVIQPQAPFRTERLMFSPQSFPLSWMRRVLTWAPVKAGRFGLAVERAAARVLGVNLRRDREIREYLSEEDAEAALAKDDPDVLEGYDYDTAEVRWYRVSLSPLTRGERALSAFERVWRTAAKMAGMREAWQTRQMSLLVLEQVTVGNEPQFRDGGVIPTDMFAPGNVDTFVSFTPTQAKQTIELRVRNGTRRVCQLRGALIGTAAR